MEASITIRFPQLALGQAETRDSSQLQQQSSDEALLQEAARGSRDAFSVLFRRYARSVRAVSFRVLRDHSEADDLVQEIFLLVYKNCTNFDPSRAPFRFWIFQMTYRRAISRRRYLSTRHFYTMMDLESAAAEAASAGATSLLVERSLDVGKGNQDLYRLFGNLSLDQKQTLRLFFIEGYTFDEIAAKLGHTRGNVKNHYFRGLEKLRKALFGSKLPGERAV